MDNNIDKIFKNFSQVRLTDAERLNLRKHLLSVIELSPIKTVRDDRKMRHQGSHDVSNYLAGFFGLNNIFRTPSFRTMAIGLIIALLVSGGTAFASQDALPGDILYPVKVKIVEEVRGWVSLSASSKGSWETERANRRLEEIEQLSDESRLDEDVRERIEANFQAHADKVEVKIELLRSRADFKAAADVAAKLETSLRAHEAILLRLNAKNEAKDNVRIEPVLIKVRKNLKNIQKERIESEQQAEIKLNTEGEVKGADGKEDDNTSERSPAISPSPRRTEINPTINIDGRIKTEIDL